MSKLSGHVFLENGDCFVYTHERQALLSGLFTWSQEELAAGNRSKASRIFKVYNRLANNTR